MQRRAGADIDTEQPLLFQFDGKDYLGYQGDTLASALLANGVAVVGRSFKFHRPRGLFGMGHEDANALVQLEVGATTEPNVRATLLPLYDGLRASSQNRWPSVRFDILALLGLFKPVLPASFYYKTFVWPSWQFWEPLVRKLAGLGRAPDGPDSQRYLKQNCTVDVLVVGAGRAGIEAAIESSLDKSKRVLLLDAGHKPGGYLLSSASAADRRWLTAALGQLRAAGNIEVRSQTLASGYYDHNLVSAHETLTANTGASEPVTRLWRIKAGRVVLATGAHERPLVFPGNDRPGVMLASAVREYFLRFGVTPCSRAAFYVNNDSGWLTALQLAGLGFPVEAIVDIRHAPGPGLLAQAEQTGISTYCGYAVTATRGRSGLSKIVIGRLDMEAAAMSGASVPLPCDLLAVSGGWTPAVHLWSQSGGRLAWREADACFVPASANQAVTAVGYANGEFEAPLNLTPLWRTPGLPPSRQWVDLQYDVTAADVALAARENYRSVEHFKRYTTNGMSIDQGKTSNINGLALLAEAVGRPIDEVGTTTFRPPYHPVPVGSYAGDDIGQFYRPRLYLPAHAAHVDLGGQFADFAGWQRPECYPLPGESEAATLAREVRSVRNGVGLLDYSSLGKIEVTGPDAREFLNRIYANNMQTLKPGHARYGLMLNEAGVVFDDGVAVCMDDERFLVHTTSANAAAVYHWLEEALQCEWRSLRVIVCNVTSEWATLMLSGPLSRKVLARLPGTLALDRDRFRHMQFQSAQLCEVPARVLRASFTGEVSFEVSVPADYAISLWQQLMDAGESEGIAAFGVESLMVLRTEKGFLHLGADTDTSTMPQDLGWGHVIARKQKDFLGRRSLSLPVAKDPDRKQLTGVTLCDDSAVVQAGAHVLAPDSSNSQGFVTSACYSPTLGRTVALALVESAQSRVGESVVLFDRGQRLDALLTPTCALDPDGERLRV